MSDELTKRGVTDLAELIRTRAVSPVEVTEAHLQRIEDLNPQLNAIITLAPDAIDRAREAERKIMSGEELGILEGVPLTVKDTINTKGLLTTAGTHLYAHRVPEWDAPAVVRLKRNGAIVLGKTNVSELAMFYHADNPLWGRTNNPHNPAYTSGGSSGGEAAAISACLSPAGLGSDLMGSIRVPVHFCGIYGFKPATGSVPSAGHIPPARAALSLGAALGPLARNVSDLALLYNVLSEDTRQTRSRTPSEFYADVQAISNSSVLRDWCAAYYTFDEVIRVTDETKLAVESAARVLEEAGLIVSEQRPPGVEKASALWLKLFAYGAASYAQELYSGHEENAGAEVRAVLEATAHRPSLSLDEFIAAWSERDLLREQLLDWMKETRLMLAPVGACEAFEHGANHVVINGQRTSIFRAFSYAQFSNVFDLPSVCVPVRRSREGLPIGVQIIGRPSDEWAILLAASILEEALGGWIKPPMSEDQATI